MPTFSINVLVGNPVGGKSVKISAIVDSAATDSVLPKSLMAELGIKATDQVAVQDVGGRSVIARGRARLCISGEERNCRVLFGPDNLALVGASFLDSFNLIVDGRNQRLLRGLEDRDFDVFVAHASEDKDEVTRPLAKALRAHGLTVWFDEFEIVIGDSIAGKIGNGLARSRSGIIIFSPAFFKRAWPQFEVNGMINRMISGEYNILPVWHNVSEKAVSEYNPSLADLWAGKTIDDDVEAIARQIAEKIRSTAYRPV